MHALVRHRDDDRIARKKTRFNVVILDCCRRFIYEDTDIGRGAEDLNWTFRNASGTCMAYACTANDTASDGTGGVHGMAARRWTWKLNMSSKTHSLRVHKSTICIPLDDNCATS